MPNTLIPWARRDVTKHSAVAVAQAMAAQASDERPRHRRARSLALALALGDNTQHSNPPTLTHHLVSRRPPRALHSSAFLPCGCAPCVHRSAQARPTDAPLSGPRACCATPANMTTTTPKMTLVDWLDDLCVRFIVNLPNEELQSVERICFQIEEAQWFYEDFIRPLDPNSLPSMHLRKFSQLMFQHCPLFSAYSEQLHQQAYEQFLAYKTRVPVRGAIMLNHDMTHAVLVKGWKKGAKWSFPRGKINKEESDLDCAVREVWEETGYDLREADLVLPNEQMKSITVTMREQSMMLYVFRGVPMDTYFEPRTRKEISKIDWYKLTDLPTLRRKNQLQQQAPAHDAIKESSFYMVAPFLGPLRAWIKQQHKLDRQRTRTGPHPAPPPAITDDEDLQTDAYEVMANTAASIPSMQPTDNFADLVARLGQSQRPTDALPELSSQPQSISDPAAELKKLLSVGMGQYTQTPPVEAPNAPAEANLLALLQGNNKFGGQQTSLPQTPFEQIMHTPAQPQSPHGQHHPHASRVGNMPPPPPFPYPPHQGMPFRGPPQHPQDMPLHIPHQFMGPPQQPNPDFHHQADFHQQARQLPQELGQSQPAHAQFTGAHGRPEIPPASVLPTPKLNAHALGLLNSFRVQDQKSTPPPPAQALLQAQIPNTTPKLLQPHPQYPPHDLVSPPYVSSPPTFQSPPLSQPQPKPRTVHQDSLLTLFQADPPAKSPEPAELSAQPTTPGYMHAHPAATTSRLPNQNLLNAFGIPSKSGLTSATVSGPVNAPDFNKMKKSVYHSANGSSRGPSPTTRIPTPRSASEATVTAVELMTPQHAGALQPQILKRTQQGVALAAGTPSTAHAQGLLNMFKGPSPQPEAAQPAQVHPKVADRPESRPSEQKHALLALFNKASPQPESAKPVQSTRTPLPPTPKKQMSGLVSPVSPLPYQGSQGGSPADFASRSRISSVGESAPSIAIPPTSHPAAAGQGAGQFYNQPGAGGSGLSVGASRQSVDGRSPAVDKSFLLGFLEDVARRGR
jgi:mRNA-decapping enzyme subunit 2